MQRFSRWAARLGLLGAVFAIGLLVQPVIASSGLVDFDDHWLGAGCQSSGGRAQVVSTPHGPAVEVGGRPRTVTLYCNITADGFHNWIQLWAEDDNANGSVTATLYRHDVTDVAALPAPEALISVSTVDTPGPQVVELFDDTDAIGDLDETNYLYYMEITIERGNGGPALRVYNASLRDVF